MPAAAWHVGVVWQRLGPGAAVRDRRTEQPWLAVRDPAEAQRLRGKALGTDRGRRYAVLCGDRWQAARADQSCLRAERRGTGAHRPREPGDHGGFDPQAVSASV